MLAEPSDYKNRVLRHLQQYRPKQYAAAKKDGSLDEQVESLAVGIASWVNSQEPSEEELQNLDPLERSRTLNSAKMFAESDAMREMLPRDEASDALIGPTGGYEDP